MSWWFLFVIVLLGCGGTRGNANTHWWTIVLSCSSAWACLSTDTVHWLVAGKPVSFLSAHTLTHNEWVNPEDSLCLDSFSTGLGLTSAKLPSRWAVSLLVWCGLQLLLQPAEMAWRLSPHLDPLPIHVQTPTKGWGQQRVAVITGYSRREVLSSLEKPSYKKGRWWKMQRCVSTEAPNS